MLTEKLKVKSRQRKSVHFFQKPSQTVTNCLERFWIFWVDTNFLKVLKARIRKNSDENLSTLSQCEKNLIRPAASTINNMSPKG